MSDLLIVVILAAGTLLMRASLVAILGEVTIPPRLEQALRLVAPAVLAGVVVQALVFDGDGFRTAWSWYLGAAIAAAVAWRTRSIPWTLAAGMAAVWALGAVL